MSKKHHMSQKLLWLFMAAVICGVIAAGFLTNRTLRSIEKNLPNTLLQELNDLSSVLYHLSETVTAAKEVKNWPSTAALDQLRYRTETVYNDIIALRESYVFDNLVQASAFHAVVAPAETDLQIWLTEGVSGYPPDSEVTAALALARIHGAFEKAKALNSAANLNAQKIFVRQRQRLDRFLFSANLLFILTAVTALSMVVLLIRQYLLERREAVAQAQLSDQRHLLDSLFDNVLLGITVWHQDGRLLLTNRGFTEITGYTMPEIRSQEDWFGKAFPDPDYRNRALADWRETIRQKSATREFDVTCKDGVVKSIEFRGAFLPDGRALVTMSDMSERKQTEQMLRESQEIKARFRKMESLGLLAGGVAHDLNNILSGIVSYPELLLMDLPGDSKLRKPIQTIQESGQRAAAIVLDLLTVARGVASVKESLSLNRLIQDYLNSPEFDMLRQHHTAFEVFFPASRETLSADAPHRPIDGFRGNKERILVVDDVGMQRKLVCSMLERLGYMPVSVASGEEAVEYVKQHAVDLVILDMIMDPGINGRETYERVIRIRPHQKAIIASGYAETEELKKAQALGAGSYLRKPFSMESLGSAIREEIEKAR